MAYSKDKTVAPFKSVACELNKSKYNGVVGFGYLLIDDSLRVNITVREHDGKIFPCFPQQKKSDNSYIDMAFPVTKEARAQIIVAIKKAVDEL